VLASAGIDNAYASEETSQRVRRGVDDHVAAGKPYGPVLYGYERIYDPKTKEFLEQRPHPEQAPVVKDIITSVYEGKSLMSIAARLNEAGIASPRGAKWSMRTVGRVALNQGYIGLRGHNGRTTQGIWPNIVEPEVFYGAKRILTDPKRTTTRPGRAKWLASCIARCGECGGWMSVLRRGANRTVYQCRDHGCTWIEREDLDDYLSRLVVERCSRPEVYPQLPDGTDDSGAVEQLRGQLAGLRAQLDGYAEDAADGKIDRVFAAKVVAKLTTKIEDKQREIEAAVTPLALAGLLSGDPGDNVSQRWERAPVCARREVLRLLFGSITVVKGRGGVEQRVTIQWR
jgi:site-specific DNA recombinase